MKSGFKIDKHDQVLFITVILVVAAAALMINLSNNENNSTTGATILDVQPLIYYSMDTSSLSSKEVLKSQGTYETDRYGGKIKNAWIFDGRNDYVLTSSSLKDLEEFTIMFWLKPADLSLRKRAHIFWQGELNEKKPTLKAGNGWGKEQEMHLSLGDELSVNKYESHKLTFYFGDEKKDLKLSTPITFSDWQHVAVTVKNSKQGAIAELFFDGKSVDKKRLNSKINQDKWDSTLNFGRAGEDGPSTDSNRHFEGKIDEFIVYDKILSSNEISRVCRRQNKGNYC